MLFQVMTKPMAGGSHSHHQTAWFWWLAWCASGITVCGTLFLSLPPLAMTLKHHGAASDRARVSVDFSEAQGLAQLAEPLGIEAFDGTTGGAEVRMEFPGRGELFVGYWVSMPLGAEKPILRPMVSREHPQSGGTS